jgi:hypothetical protein
MWPNLCFNIHRIDPLTGNYGEIINSYRAGNNATNAMNAAISYAKSEKLLNRYHYAVSNGLTTVFDTRDSQ